MTDLNLVATHAVVLLDDPPTLLNVLTLIGGLVEILLRKLRVHTAQKKRREGCNFFRLKVRFGHLEFFERRAFFSLVEKGGVGEFPFEETLVVVPTVMFGFMGEQRKVQPLDRLAPLFGELGADARLFLEGGNLMTTRASEVAHQGFALSLEFGVVQIGGRGVGGVVLFQGH